MINLLQRSLDRRRVLGGSLAAGAALALPPFRNQGYAQDAELPVDASDMDALIAGAQAENKIVSYGMPREWYQRTLEIEDGRNVAALGPYPSRGEYELAFTRTSLMLHERSAKGSLASSRASMESTKEAISPMMDEASISTYVHRWRTGPAW